MKHIKNYKLFESLLGSQGKENPYQTVELNEETQIDEKIYSFAIKYKE